MIMADTGGMAVCGVDRAEVPRVQRVADVHGSQVSGSSSFSTSRRTQGCRNSSPRSRTARLLVRVRALRLYLSSELVSLVNKVMARHGAGGCLGNNNLNKDWLHLFYWMLAAFSVVNFFC